ncbi:putative histone promoter control 2 protein [Erysiphe neolycopersici]|uniref:Putative histone promoter control 2 protein n=1 Tax=Erysiphe neolycopersici TaxID=212602 RepID=A0A420HTZ6_9PEZI|nr:putative histone promoter control 2 protein [Erysiphe neolycopersici]
MQFPASSYSPRKSLEFGLPRSPTQPSSEGLSSPPRSSPEAVSPSRRIVNKLLPSHAPSTSSSSVTTSVLSTTKVDASSEKPPSRKPRKKLKDPSAPSQPKASKAHSSPGSAATATATPTATTTTTTDGSEVPKPKRVRKPKDPNAPPAQRRKKNITPAKVNENNDDDSKANLMIKLQLPSSKTKSDSNALTNVSTHSKNVEESQYSDQTFFNNVALQNSQAQPQDQLIRKSGQKYDPIRSSNYDPVRETVVSHSSSNKIHSFHNKSNTINNASTTPSISSLVDPQHQQQSSTPPASQSFFTKSLSKSALGDTQSGSISSNPKARDPSTKVPESSKSNSSSNLLKKSEVVAPSSQSKKNNSHTKGSSSTSPKLLKSKEMKEVNNAIIPAPPPLPGMGNESSNSNDYRAPTVILEIPLNGEVNKYVNFTRLAEQQYGWDAIHPRLAAQRDRLARVAAAGAALERNGSNKDSGDEMSLDSEAEGSNVEMGGMSDGRTGVDNVKKVPKKRKMREDEYDKDDGFVDDTELLWEEQAAATNDGFFVYSGPLIPEGEKASIDTKADGTAKRGRGRGSRGGTTRGSGTRGGVTSANTSGRNNLPSSGPGSRGGIGTRKPRVTKADRARIEQEKIEREKIGLDSNSTSLSAATPTKTPTAGNVPVLVT